MIINKKNFHDQSIDSNTKDYTTVCLLDYDYNKNNYRLIAVDLNRKRKLDVVPKAVQQIEFVGWLMNDVKDANPNGALPNNDHYKFV